MPLASLCIYCGSNSGADPAFIQAAEETGRLLGERGLRLIYGGGNIGLMGRLADAALAAGAEVIGVIPQSLAEKEVAHRGLSELMVVDNMHERKLRMATLADAFIALPGGIGTLEELFEVWTWQQLGFHGKPLGLLDVAGYYRPLLDFLDHMVAQRFLRLEHRQLLLADDQPQVLLERLVAHQPTVCDKWYDRRSQT